ncbi:5' nucleotidase-like protein [Sarcoptes scabiei]|nr:5' nucleotidase-like protein [Sarcoptes scabiei]
MKQFSQSSLSSSSIYILHFNDCYNVEPCDQEPVGGAARFVNALRQFDHLEPLILFSGDILAPSIMSSFTKGEQMLPVLKKCKVDCALFGNHEFDFGLEYLISVKNRTDFPWLMSNVICKKTLLPLGEGEITHIIEKSNIRIGLIGLIEQEWLSTLTIDENDIHYEDFITVGRNLAKKLKSVDHVDIVIALTHMRNHNDIKLAENVDEIDLILGGHDHIYDVKLINKKYLIKSGTDFRQFSKIEMIVSEQREIVDIKVEEVAVTSKIAEDSELVLKLEQYKTVLEEKMDNIMACLDCDLDCRFSKVRTQETNIGNLIADIMLYTVPDADFALLNSGTLRSDRIHPKGLFTMRDLVHILPYMDSTLVINVNAHQIIQALENGVSQYPKYEGRFPQVSGISFEFDSKKPPGSRVNEKSILIQGKPLIKDKIYKMVTKEFIAQGKDGYDVLKDCTIHRDTELCLSPIQAFQEYIETLRISQILLLKDQDSQKKSNSQMARISRDTFKQIDSTMNSLKEKIDYICHLNPKIEGRINLVL